MDVAETENLKLQVMNKELKAIVWLGAGLGLIMGSIRERLDILIPKYYCSEPFNRHFAYTIPLDENAKSGLFVCEKHGIKMNPDYIGSPKEVSSIRVESFWKGQ